MRDLSGGGQRTLEVRTKVPWAQWPTGGFTARAHSRKYFYAASALAAVVTYVAFLVLLLYTLDGGLA
jgi:hypothetical protein